MPERYGSPGHFSAKTRRHESSSNVHDRSSRLSSASSILRALKPRSRSGVPHGPSDGSWAGDSDPKQLGELVESLANAPATRITKLHGITNERAETLLGGTLVLAAVAERLDCELEVGRGGLREGAALALARPALAAA